MRRFGAAAAAFAFAFALFCVELPAAYAAEPLTVHYENHAGAPGVLSVYVNTNHAETLAAGDFAVTLSGQTLAPLGIARVSDTGEGVSWLLAIDVSGSIAAGRMTLLRAALTSLAEQMDARDNAAFLLIGDDARATAFLSDKAEMLDFIANLETLREDTNLYKGIVTAVRTLETDAAAFAKRAVVVFSDGEDDIVEGFTREETEQVVAAARIPVYTVALQGQNPSAAAVEGAKILASFARMSAGGVSQTLKPDGETPEAVASAIAASVYGGYVLELDLTGASLPQDQGLLELQLSASGQEASDGVLINAAALRAFIPAPESPTPTQAEEPAPESPPTDSVGALPFILGGGVLMLAAILIALLRVRKKRAAAMPEPNTPASRAAMSAPVPIAAARPRWRFTLIKVGLTESERFAVEVTDELIIGRSAGHLAIPTDSRLSARHCRIFERGGAFYVEDLHSTNGTYLNGAPVAQPQPVEPDSVLLIGSMELRVTWTRI
ncbi:MAG: FHA domain-containing protein [Oscillospiraceae bacterium]|jgi:hypothetical protein|nr:FHA domain-containing protein [Oscillospiraceae bacterium]